MWGCGCIPHLRLCEASSADASGGLQTGKPVSRFSQPKRGKWTTPKAPRLGAVHAGPQAKAWERCDRLGIPNQSLTLSSYRMASGSLFLVLSGIPLHSPVYLKKEKEKKKRRRKKATKKCLTVLFCILRDITKPSLVMHTRVGEWGGELRGSRLEAWMKSHKSEVAIT